MTTIYRGPLPSEISQHFNVSAGSFILFSLLPDLSGDLTGGLTGHTAKILPQLSHLISGIFQDENKPRIDLAEDIDIELEDLEMSELHSLLTDIVNDERAEVGDIYRGEEWPSKTYYSYPRWTWTSYICMFIKRIIKRMEIIWYVLLLSCECGQGRKLCSESSDDINKTEYLLNMLRIFALDQGGEGSEKQVTILRRPSGVYLWSKLISVTAGPLKWKTTVGLPARSFPVSGPNIAELSSSLGESQRSEIIQTKLENFSFARNVCWDYRKWIREVFKNVSPAK